MNTYITIPDIDKVIVGMLDLPVLHKMVIVNKFFYNCVQSVRVYRQYHIVKEIVPKTLHAKFGYACYRGFLQYAIYLSKRIDNSFDYNIIFAKVCEHGRLDVAKWLVANYKIDISSYNEKAFRESCKNGHHEVAKWLIQISELPGQKKININARSEYAFRYSCANSRPDIAEWLIRLGESDNYTKININCKEYSSAFMLCFKNNNAEMARWLVQFAEFNYTHIKYDAQQLFFNCCTTGNIKMAKLLIQLGNIDDHYKFDVNSENNLGFGHCCAGGHIEMGKWLLQLCETDKYNSISIDYGYVINKCCVSDNVDAAQWLIQLYELDYDKMDIGRKMDISDRFDSMINTCCECKKFAMAKLLIKADIRYHGVKKINNIFGKCCKNNFLSLAKWLVGWWETYRLTYTSGVQNLNTLLDTDTIRTVAMSPLPAINIHRKGEHAFRSSCKNGNNDMIKWLIDLGLNKGYGKIDIHVSDDSAFISACVCENLDTAKLLLQIGETDDYTPINIYAENEKAFKKCSKMYNKHNVSKWLVNISANEKYRRTDQYLLSDIVG